MLSEKYKDIINKVTYRDPQTRKLIENFAIAYKKNDLGAIEISLEALRKRKIEIIPRAGNKFDIKKMKDTGKDSEGQEK